jgi:hypothetical protein
MVMSGVGDFFDPPMLPQLFKSAAGFGTELFGI